MKYPKPVMTTSELVEMGFSASLLRKMLREPGQKFAFRYNPPNGNIYWDTGNDILQAGGFDSRNAHCPVMDNLISQPLSIRWRGIMNGWSAGDLYQTYPDPALRNISSGAEHLAYQKAAGSNPACSIQHQHRAIM